MVIKLKTLKIEVTVKNIEELYHPLNNKTLNPSLANLLYDECLGKEKKSKIDIHIITYKKIQEEKKEEIRHLIHNHFKEQKKEIQLKKQTSHLFYSSILLIGILFLLLSFITQSELIEEILLILGWIAIWEVVENFLFQESKESLKQKRYKELGSARIYYKEDI